MKKKRRLRKLTGCVFLVFLLCTALARQFEMLLLPKVLTAAIGAGTVTHQSTYPATAEGFKVSWIIDKAEYEYYKDTRKAGLTWICADGREREELFKITHKKENTDGTWTFMLNAKKISKEGVGGLFGTLSVCLENEVSYPYTLPLSALSMDADGYMVFAVQTKQGLFSDVQTVTKIPLRVLDQDSHTAAVSSGWAERVVTYTSRPLAEGMRVVTADGS